jgi:hypothetical protein
VVWDYLVTATEEVLGEARPHPWAPERRATVLHCLHVILNGEWEHQHYAVSDLRIAARGQQPGGEDPERRRRRSVRPSSRRPPHRGEIAEWTLRGTRGGACPARCSVRLRALG